MSWIKLHAIDGHVFGGWLSEPPKTVPQRGALVVLPEIFGVNAHIRRVCQRYAAQGWLALAPSLFDRAEPGAELGYEASDLARARSLKAVLDDERALLDVQAAIDHTSSEGNALAVVGFCWGGTLAWLAASRLRGVHGAVAYYGTNIAGYLKETPSVPVLLHFGEQDPHIPADSVAAIENAHPGIALHRYPTGHGFNCDERTAYHHDSAILASERTQAFLEKLRLR